ADGRENVDPLVVHRLFGDRECVVSQKGSEPASDLRLAARCRVDIHERARQLYRIHASRSVRVSVRESRYLTITGVASDRRQSGPLPAVTARAPGTTTAPSGITIGRSGA